MKKHHIPNLREVFRRVRSYESHHRLVLSLAFMVFFFLLCDGVVGYFVPIAMTRAGMNTFQMGILVSTSSIAGLLFDQILLRVFKQTHFHRLFFYMFVFALLFPFIIWRFTSVVAFFLGMAVWGVYYDLYNCGTMDFIGRYTPKKDHAASYGVVGVFIACAYLISPLLASGFSNASFENIVFYVAYGFLGIAFILFLILRNRAPKQTTSLLPEHSHALPPKSQTTFFQKCVLLTPILLVSMMINLMEAFYWTVAPLLHDIGGVAWDAGGVFLFVHQLPILLTGWFIGNITQHHSKKYIAYSALLVGSAGFLSFFVWHNIYALLCAGFFSSLALSFVWPAVNGMYADVIQKKPEDELLVQTAQDSFGNIGYIIGPALAGGIALLFGTIHAFAWMGVIGVLLSCGLFIFSSRSHHAA